MDKLIDDSNRRNFLKTGILGTAVLGVSGLEATDKTSGVFRKRHEPEWKNRQEGMRYRMLGSTGMMVSALGMCSGFQEDNYRFIYRAIDRGINYIDTAHKYRSGRNEIMVGKILKDIGRDKLFVSTKLSRWKWSIDEHCMEIFKGLPSEKKRRLIEKSQEIIESLGVSRAGYYYKFFEGHEKELPTGYLTYVIKQEYGGRAKWKPAFKAEMHRSIDESLSRMKTDHVDILHGPHGARMPQELEDPLVSEVFSEIRKMGKARFFGASFHSDMSNMILKAAELDYYDMVMPAYNIVVQGSVDMVLNRAAETGLGIFGMKAANPIMRGEIPPWRIAKLNHAVKGDLTLAQKAYAWVLNNPDVAGCLSDMKDESMMEENLAVLDKEFSILAL